MALKIQTQDVMQFFVHGTPYAQTRARHVVKADGSQQVYSSAGKGLKVWRAAIAKEVLQALSELKIQPLEGALCVDMVFRLATKDKTRWGELCGMKPDKDNLEKAVLDVMGDAGVFAVGDQQVACGEVAKVWCAAGESGVLVRVRRARMKKAPVSGEEQGLEAVSWLA